MRSVGVYMSVSLPWFPGSPWSPRLTVAAVWLAFAPAAYAVSSDTGTDTGTSTADTGPAPDIDSDEDGWTLGAGDCDDANPLVNPGRPDVCFDRLDNDCSSLADEGCDNSARIGSIGGGGACTGDGNIAGTRTALVVPLVLVAGLRRRRLR
jgi:hypothetical protein